MPETLPILFTALLDSLSDGICISDGRGKILYLNPAAQRLLGRSPPDFGGESVCALLCGRLSSPGSPECASDCPLRPEDSKETAVTFEGLHHPLFAGGAKPLRVRCLKWSVPWLDAVEPDLHLTLIEDNSKAQELERRKEEWRHMIMHDVKSPMTTIYVGLKLLQETPQFKTLHEPERSLLPNSLLACGRILQLIERYLDIAKLESGILPVKPLSLRLAALLRGCLREVEGVAASSGVGLSLEVPEDLAARADYELLSRVAQNILGNALKFTPRGGRVKLAARRAAPGKVEVSFKDTGPGIAAEDLPHIFDRFYRSRLREKQKVLGTGLGLAFCRQAMLAMKGTIRVDSRPGAGCEFILELPEAAAPAGGGA